MSLVFQQKTEEQKYVWAEKYLKWDIWYTFVLF